MKAIRLRKRGKPKKKIEISRIQKFASLYYGQYLYISYNAVISETDYISLLQKKKKEKKELTLNH